MINFFVIILCLPFYWISFAQNYVNWESSIQRVNLRGQYFITTLTIGILAKRLSKHRDSTRTKEKGMILDAPAKLWKLHNFWLIITKRSTILSILKMVIWMVTLHLLFHLFCLMIYYLTNTYITPWLFLLTTILKLIMKPSNILNWFAMKIEIQALQHNKIWHLTDLSHDKILIDMKLNINWMVWLRDTKSGLWQKLHAN